MRALEALVTRMESESLSLEESLEHYQQGLALVQTCQGALESAQKRIAGTLTQEPIAARPEDTRSTINYPEITDQGGHDTPR